MLNQIWCPRCVVSANSTIIENDALANAKQMIRDALLEVRPQS